MRMVMRLIKWSDGRHAQNGYFGHERIRRMADHLPMGLLQAPPRYLFFTGKGGVGKTSIACAVALALAEQGRRVLLVSTDPASNIAQVFGTTIGNQVTTLPASPYLDALEIDPSVRRQVAALIPAQAHVANLWHETIDIDAVERLLLPLMDGTRSREELASAIRVALGDGSLPIQAGAAFDPDVRARELLDAMLGKLRDAAVLKRKG